MDNLLKVCSVFFTGSIRRHWLQSEKHILCHQIVIVWPGIEDREDMSRFWFRSCSPQPFHAETVFRSNPVTCLPVEISSCYESSITYRGIVMSTWLNSKAPPPAWLRWFANDAARAILDTAVHAPIGCHYHYGQESNEWEVTVFVSDTEVVGGPRDGTLVPCRVQLDVSRAIELFDETPKIHWQAGALQDDEDVDQHVSFEGSVRGQLVWLRILAQAPRQAGPGRLLHASTGELEDLW